MHRSGLLLLLVLALAVPVGAQVPTGTIVGTVVDQVGAVLATRDS